MDAWPIFFDCSCVLSPGSSNEEKEKKSFENTIQSFRVRPGVELPSPLLARDCFDVRFGTGSRKLSTFSAKNRVRQQMRRRNFRVVCHHLPLTRSVKKRCISLVNHQRNAGFSKPRHQSPYFFRSPPELFNCEVATRRTIWISTGIMPTTSLEVWRQNFGKMGNFCGEKKIPHSGADFSPVLSPHSGHSIRFFCRLWLSACLIPFYAFKVRTASFPFRSSSFSLFRYFLCHDLY